MSCYVTCLSCRLSMIFLIGIFFLRTILLAGHMAVYFNLNTEAFCSFASICTLLHQICLNLTTYLFPRYFVDLNKEKLIMKKTPCTLSGALLVSYLLPYSLVASSMMSCSGHIPVGILRYYIECLIH